MSDNKKHKPERTIAIGDIHGYWKHLEKLLEYTGYKNNDRLIFLGDLIDRGENPKKTIDLVVELMKNNNKNICLMGNHEDMLLSLLMNDNKHGQSIWLANGGDTTLKSFGLRINKIQEIDLKYRNFLLILKQIYIDDDLKLIFSHAGLDPEKTPDKQDKFDIYRGPMWIRSDFYYSRDPAPGYRVIFGHTPTFKIKPGLKSVLWEKNKIGIDTGLYYFNKLTGLEIIKDKPFKAYYVDFDFNTSIELEPEEDYDESSNT